MPMAKQEHHISVLNCLNQKVQIMKVKRGTLTRQVTLPPITQTLMAGPKSKGFQRGMLCTKPSEMKGLSGMVAKVQNQSMTKGAKSRHCYSIRLLGSMTCSLKKPTDSHE